MAAQQRTAWSLRELTAEEAEAAVPLLTAAFATPLEFRWVAGADDGREGSSDRHREYCHWNMRFSTLLARSVGSRIIGAFAPSSADKPACVAITFPPGVDSSNIQAVQAVVAEIGRPPMYAENAELCGWDKGAKRRHRALASTAGKIHHNATGGRPHLYLNILGTDPAQQGTGAGIAVLEYLKASAAAAQVPFYLETTGPTNPQFYMKRGFRISEKMVVDPGNGLMPLEANGGFHAMIVDPPSRSKL